MRRLRRSAAIAVGVVAAIGLGGFPAAADPAVPEPGEVRIARFDESALKKAAQPFSALKATASVARERVRQHLDEAARNGRLVDESRMMVAELPDPHTPGEEITLVWDSPKPPTEVLYSTKAGSSGGGDHRAAIGVQMGGGDTTGMPTERAGQSRAGSGYSAVFEIDNMYLEDNGCSTGWFAPTYYASDYDHKIVSCYEVWGVNNTPIFTYNRWALWTPAEAYFPLIFVETEDMEVSARPWAGHESKIHQLADWAPRSGDTVGSCDSNRNFTMGGSWGGFTGSVTMPINVCEEYWLNVTAGPGSQNRMTIDFDGERGGQMYMDIAGKYDAVDQYVLPYWADRNYMQLEVCGPDFICENEAWAKADSGW
ncbi:hypothetical protein [Actinophytocola glycyrrhizae]|uniref:DUF239 domain-containing protein n=1 Tax=Actinophytocola glycyrrhizae TaxID=2044873 RepID=A0ABV9S4J3_9PSEU